MEIRTRDEAIDLGLSRYFTGKACKRGHLSERYTTSANCVECTTEAAKAHRQEVRDRLQAARAEHGG